MKYNKTRILILLVAWNLMSTPCHGVEESWTQLSDFHFHFTMVIVRVHIILFILTT